MDYLGKRIKFLRKQQKRTQDEIAEQCGFTKSLLSKIENGISTPPVSTLVKIADSLGVKVSDLLEENMEQETSFTPASTATDTGNWITTSKGYSFFAFASEFAHKEMQPYLFEAERGKLKKHTFSHEGEEYIFMLEGSMKYSISGIEYTLTPGDSVYFKSLQDHHLTPVTEKVKYLAVFSQTDKPEDHN